MRFHPVQTNAEALEKIALAFRYRMSLKGILPKNPWKAKRVHEWLARMGARMKPGSFRFDPHMGCVDCANYVNFKVFCPPSKNKIRGEKSLFFMRVEIPWELADKVLTLGYLP
jgi:hypothetical protein